MKITKEQISQLVGEFTWCWGQDFFVETEIGNFHWKDPDYGGDNTIRPFNGNPQDFCKHCHCEFGRYKGKHVIEKYIGKDFTLVE